MTVLYNEIKKELESLAEPDFQQFTARLIPNIPSDHILGVRLPKLRKIAKEIAKKDPDDYLKLASDETFEEVMLQGMVIGYLDEGIEKIQDKMESFIKKIDNWSVCDSFCSGLKIAKRYPDEMWIFVKKYLRDERTYFIRFGVVMSIFYFLEEDYIDECLSAFDQIKSEEYYVRMAVAWAVSICYLKFPEKTMEYLKNNDLDDFTYNKALQKIIESQRTDLETKKKMRKLKR